MGLREVLSGLTGSHKGRSVETTATEFDMIDYSSEGVDWTTIELDPDTLLPSKQCLQRIQQYRQALVGPNDASWGIHDAYVDDVLLTF